MEHPVLVVLHSVCFINNVYKQRFFQLVKIFQNLNNRTSQNLYVKQRMNQMKTRIQFSSGPSSIFRLAVRFQQIIFFRHHKCRMQITVPILTLINTNPCQVSCYPASSDTYNFKFVKKISNDYANHLSKNKQRLNNDYQIFLLANQSFICCVVYKTY